MYYKSFRYIYSWLWSQIEDGQDPELQRLAQNLPRTAMRRRTNSTTKTSGEPLNAGGLKPPSTILMCY